jgi:hypothetical protein
MLQQIRLSRHLILSSGLMQVVCGRWQRGPLTSLPKRTLACMRLFRRALFFTWGADRKYMELEDLLGGRLVVCTAPCST